MISEGTLQEIQLLKERNELCMFIYMAVKIYSFYNKNEKKGNVLRVIIQIKNQGTNKKTEE